jgi:hypothetical protein
VARNIDIGFRFSLDGLRIQAAWWYAGPQQIALFRARGGGGRSGPAVRTLETVTTPVSLPRRHWSARDWLVAQLDGIEPVHRWPPVSVAERICRDLPDGGPDQFPGLGSGRHSVSLYPLGRRGAELLVVLGEPSRDPESPARPGARDRPSDWTGC